MFIMHYVTSEWAYFPLALALDERWARDEYSRLRCTLIDTAFVNMVMEVRTALVSRLKREPLKWVSISAAAWRINVDMENNWTHIQHTHEEEGKSRIVIDGANMWNKTKAGNVHRLSITSRSVSEYGKCGTTIRFSMVLKLKKGLMSGYESVATSCYNTIPKQRLILSLFTPESRG